MSLSAWNVPKAPRVTSSTFFIYSYVTPLIVWSHAGLFSNWLQLVRLFCGLAWARGSISSRNEEEAALCVLPKYKDITFKHFRPIQCHFSLLRGRCIEQIHNESCRSRYAFYGARTFLNASREPRGFLPLCACARKFVRGSGNETRPGDAARSDNDPPARKHGTNFELRMENDTRWRYEDRARFIIHGAHMSWIPRRKKKDLWCEIPMPRSWVSPSSQFKYETTDGQSEIEGEDEFLSIWLSWRGTRMCPLCARRDICAHARRVMTQCRDTCWISQLLSKMQTHLRGIIIYFVGKLNVFHFQVRRHGMTSSYLTHSSNFR